MKLHIGTLTIVCLLVLLPGCKKQQNAVSSAEDADAKAAVVQPSAGKAQTTCPVMGGPVDKHLYVDYEGKRIYVCCGACVAEVKKDPAKYIQKLEAEGVTLDTVK